MTRAVLAYPGNDALARALSASLGCEMLVLEARQFPDGEFYFRVTGDVEGKTIVIACSLDRPNEKVVGLLLLASKLRELGACKLVLVAPYLAYMRQDKAFHPGEGVSARYFATLLSSCFDGLVTVDPHLHRIHALSEIYTIPTRVVHAAPVISAWIKANVKAPIVIGPDAESEQWARDIGQGASCPVLVLQKKRTGDREVEVSLPDIEPLHGRSPVLVDDIISTGRTMIAAALHLREAKMLAPVCIGVHAIFAGDAYTQLAAAGAARIVSCNTIAHASNAIDVRALVAEALIALKVGSA